MIPLNCFYCGKDLTEDDDEYLEEEGNFFCSDTCRDAYYEVESEEE